MTTNTGVATRRTGKAPKPTPGRWRRTGDGARSAVATAVLIVLCTAMLETGSRLELWTSATLPPPSEVLPAAGALLGTGQFWRDAARSGVEIGTSISFGLLAGLGLGVVFWKLPIAGRIFEPYLIAFYSVPLVLFYPMMIVLVGLNIWSVIILASIMAAIPMTLNTWVGLSGVPAVYMRLARSITCTRTQTLFCVALPAAAPFVFAGARLATAYALIGAIAMEFTTAQAGLGYRIRYLYESFDTVHMYAYVAIVLGVSILLTAVLEIVERVLFARRVR
ncbi:ABC transporter permease [Nonomuraea sp. NPDC050451]|uniref:ABC transporter permease n=1 Tax=Nonomuraea sp. NPDC050451 TaxID=3364364 RepID=UPI0037970FCA